MVAHICRFPQLRPPSVIEIVEIEPGRWIGDIDVGMRLSDSRGWPTYAQAAAYAAGIASVTGLPLIDWTESTGHRPHKGDAA